MKRTANKTLTGSTGASFSNCMKYRYTLWRSWGAGYFINFLMLNPSTADDVTNDPTVERCERRAKMMGYGGLIVTNLFAFRATDPKEMRAARDPIGEKNDDAILESADQSAMVLCAWGQHGKYRSRDSHVLSLLAGCGHKLHYLKLAKDGTPCHPLYLPYELKPTQWKASE